jgi:hypothetical protein
MPSVEQLEDAIADIFDAYGIVTCSGELPERLRLILTPKIHAAAALIPAHKRWRSGAAQFAMAHELDKRGGTNAPAA